MEIVVPPPAAVVWFLLGLPLFTLGVMLFLRRAPLVHRVLPVALVSLACGVVYAVALRPMRFSWDEGGIVDDTFGPARRIAWSDIRDVRLVPRFRSTEFRPVLRTNGTAYSGWGSGTFRLANGASVRVFFEPGSVDALLVTTADATYLYAPRAFERFREAARSHSRGIGVP